MIQPIEIQQQKFIKIILKAFSLIRRGLLGGLKKDKLKNNFDWNLLHYNKYFIMSKLKMINMI